MDFFSGIIAEVATLQLLKIVLQHYNAVLILQSPTVLYMQCVEIRRLSCLSALGALRRLVFCFVVMCLMAGIHVKAKDKTIDNALPDAMCSYRQRNGVQWYSTSSNWRCKHHKSTSYHFLIRCQCFLEVQIAQ